MSKFFEDKSHVAGLLCIVVLAIWGLCFFFLPEYQMIEALLGAVALAFCLRFFMKNSRLPNRQERFNAQFPAQTVVTQAGGMLGKKKGVLVYTDRGIGIEVGDRSSGKFDFSPYDSMKSYERHGDIFNLKMKRDGRRDLTVTVNDSKRGSEVEDAIAKYLPRTGHESEFVKAETLPDSPEAAK